MMASSSLSGSEVVGPAEVTVPCLSGTGSKGSPTVVFKMTQTSWPLNLSVSLYQCAAVPEQTSDQLAGVMWAYVTHMGPVWVEKGRREGAFGGAKGVRVGNHNNS